MNINSKEFGMNYNDFSKSMLNPKCYDNINNELDLDCVEMLECDDMLNVISSGSFVNLGISKNDQPYVIPMSYNYEKCDDHYIFTLYSKCDGSKVKIISNNKKVSLEFIKHLDDSIMSVLILGLAEVNQTKFDTCCNENMVSIRIEPISMTGRKYYFCD